MFPLFFSSSILHITLLWRSYISMVFCVTLTLSVGSSLATLTDSFCTMGFFFLFCSTRESHPRWSRAIKPIYSFIPNLLCHPPSKLSFNRIWKGKGFHSVSWDLQRAHACSVVDIGLLSHPDVQTLGPPPWDWPKTLPRGEGGEVFVQTRTSNPRPLRPKQWASALTRLPSVPRALDSRIYYHSTRSHHLSR